MKRSTRHSKVVLSSGRLLLVGMYLDGRVLRLNLLNHAYLADECIPFLVQQTKGTGMPQHYHYYHYYYMHFLFSGKMPSTDHVGACLSMSTKSLAGWCLTCDTFEDKHHP